MLMPSEVRWPWIFVLSCHGVFHPLIVVGLDNEAMRSPYTYQPLFCPLMGSQDPQNANSTLQKAFKKYKSSLKRMAIW